jgi:hypothetical protein
MNVAVPGSVVGPLAVVFAVGDKTGFVKSGRAVIPAPTAGGDYRASLSLPVPPGDYRVRFAVSDSDDHVGSVQTNVTAALNHVGPFLASDLLTGWSGADHTPQFLALERVPAGATHLLSSLELYSATADPLPADLSVRFALVSADEAVGRGERVAVDGDGIAPRRRPVSAAIPVGSALHAPRERVSGQQARRRRHDDGQDVRDRSPIEVKPKGEVRNASRRHHSLGFAGGRPLG